MNDQQLLARYAADRSPDAFAAIVHANVDLVYAAARRQLQDSHLAEDVTQGVFLLLSQKPQTIKGPLAGWLIKATYYCCRDAKKLAARRAHHERQAMTMRPILDSASTAEPPAWETYVPLLDDALLHLRVKDRDALALRYLKGMSLQDVGVLLGISEEAARKRVDRALEHLQAYMADKAPISSTSALTAAMTALPMHAVPAGLADSITGGIVAKSALASAISHAGAKWMGWAQLKTLGAVGAGVAICAVASGAYLAIANSHNPIVRSATVAVAFPASAPAPVASANPDEDETRVPGVTFLASWDLILTPEGADAVGKVLHPVKTSSISYTGATANGVALRRAARQAMNDGQVAGISQSMIFYPGLISSQSDIILSFQNEYINYDHGHALILGGNEGPQRGKLLRIDNDHLSVKLDFPDVGVRIEDTDSSYWSENVKSAIAYEGTLTAGDAVAFLGKYTALSGKTYAHLVVWETFKAEQMQMDMRPGRNVGWWCDNGPAPLRAWANAARVWRAQSSGETAVVPAFQKTLEDGKTLQLEMLSRPSQWPYCWWDAQGNPATGESRSRISPLISFNGDPPDGLWALASVHSDDPTENKLANPFEPMQAIYPHYDEQQCREIDERSSSLDVGVAVGAWQQIGTLEPNKPQAINGVRYRITQPDQLSPDTFGVNFVRNGVLENDDLVVPTAADGRAARVQGEEPTIIFDHLTEETRAQKYFNFHDITLAEVKTWRLMERKRQWVTFTNIATMPKTTPLTSVTTADADAADPIFEERKRQAASIALAAQRKEWAAIPPDRTTAHGAIRILVDAIRAGDESTAADLMFTTKPMAASYMAGLVHYYIVQEQARQSVAEAIGRDMPESELMLLAHILLVNDLEWKLFNGDWTITPSGGQIKRVNRLPVEKGTDGTYRLNVDDMQALALSSERLSSLIAMEQQVRDTLRARHHVTLAELATIIRSPLAKATTQK